MASSSRTTSSYSTYLSDTALQRSYKGRGTEESSEGAESVKERGTNTLGELNGSSFELLVQLPVRCPAFNADAWRHY